MSAPVAPARCEAPGPAAGHPASGPADPPRECGMLSLEAVMVLPVLALLLIGVLQVAGIVRDVLVLHEAARAGARVAATTSGSEPVGRAAREAAPELPDLTVTVAPTVRRDGQLARVEVTVVRTFGPVSHRLRATAVARVEPAVGTSPRS